MFTIYGLCGSAAFKNYFRFKFCCFNNICFKKLYRQKRDLYNSINTFRVNMNRIDVLPVNRIMPVLKLKKLQRHSIKIVEGSMEDLIFPFRYFRCVIQVIIIKFEFKIQRCVTRYYFPYSFYSYSRAIKISTILCHS